MTMAPLSLPQGSARDPWGFLVSQGSHMTTNSQVYLRRDDPDARDRISVLAMRSGDMELLQELADEDPALGRRIVRKLIDGGCRWVVSRHEDGTQSPDLSERDSARINGSRGVSGVKFPECLEYTLHYVVVIAHGDSFILPVCWDDRKRRLFACDCAERVLPIFESAQPGNKGPRMMIRTARDYALGVATPGMLSSIRAATRWRRARPQENPFSLGGFVPSRAPVLDAFGAARCASHPSLAKGAVPDAAGSAARAASGVLLGCEEQDLGWNDEIDWQRSRLLTYLLDEHPL